MRIKFSAYEWVSNDGEGDDRRHRSVGIGRENRRQSVMRAQSERGPNVLLALVIPTADAAHALQRQVTLRVEHTGHSPSIDGVGKGSRYETDHFARNRSGLPAGVAR